FFSSRRRHTRFSRDWSSDVCSSDLLRGEYSEITWWCVDVAFIRHLSRRFGLEGCDVSHFMKGYRQNHSHLNSLPSLPRRDERVVELIKNTYGLSISPFVETLNHFYMRHLSQCVDIKFNEDLPSSAKLLRISQLRVDCLKKFLHASHRRGGRL